MKIKCIDVVHGVSKSGSPFTNGAFRAVSKSGSPYLFLASCPDNYKPGTDYDVRVAFTSNGNYILTY